MRDEQNKYELAAEKALVMTPALMILGRTGNEKSDPYDCAKSKEIPLILARVIAMT